MSDSAQAAWQRGMMEHDPSTCWVFVGPDRVCIRQRPCPLHEPTTPASSPPRPLPSTAPERDQ